MKFPYLQYKELRLPMVPVQIKGKEWHIVYMFVDSGATYSIMTYKEAARLGVDPEKGKDQLVRVGDGGLISLNYQKLLVKIGTTQFKATIGFSKELGVGFNIMGRKDFFEKFTVCFNDKKGIVQFS